MTIHPAVLLTKTSVTVSPLASIWILLHVGALSAVIVSVPDTLKIPRRIIICPALPSGKFTVRVVMVISTTELATGIVFDPVTMRLTPPELKPTAKSEELTMLTLTVAGSAESGVIVAPMKLILVA